MTSTEMPRSARGAKTRLERARPGADAVQGDARDVEVVDDAGQGLARLQVLQVVSSRYHRARSLREGGPDVYLDAVEGPELDGARVHHLRPAPRHLGHLLDEITRYPPRLAHYAGIGGVDAVHVGVDLAPLRLYRRRERHGRRVRSAAPERDDVAQGVHPLETGDDDDLPVALGARGSARAVISRDHTRPVPARYRHPGLRTRERDRRDAPIVQRHRQAAPPTAPRRSRAAGRSRAERGPGSPRRPASGACPSSCPSPRRPRRGRGPTSRARPNPVCDGPYVLGGGHRASAILLDDDSQVALPLQVPLVA